MDATSAASSASGSNSSQASLDLIMLKKSQDLMKQQGVAMLNIKAPPPQSPSPEGMGSNVDVSA
jgi:hypothetical protein